MYCAEGFRKTWSWLNNCLRGLHPALLLLIVLVLWLPLSPAHAAQAQAQAQACKPVFLTLDTGSMRDAQAIADLLDQRKIVATFFMANEKTVRGDYAFDDSWAPYWQRLLKDGHAFATHTLRHGKILPSKLPHTIAYRPQFGEQAGQVLRLSGAQFCDELNAVGQRFKGMTGGNIGPVWRAPGGVVTPQALQAAAACGYQHVAWSPAGFLGDELDSSIFPNKMLKERALNDIRSGDILVAHLGIWSRKEHFFPALKDILIGLQDKGFCFKALHDHPSYKEAYKP